MKPVIFDTDLLHLNLAVLRCLLEKNVISKEDLTAALPSLGIDVETAFRLNCLINEMPEK